MGAQGTLGLCHLPSRTLKISHDKRYMKSHDIFFFVCFLTQNKTIKILKINQTKCMEIFKLSL